LEKLTTGTSPYLIIQQLIEKQSSGVDMNKYNDLEQKYMFGNGEE
jgi:hypothetical protein